MTDKIMSDECSQGETRIQNVDTGMDMSVVGFKEVPGPLGGVSVEYCIKVNTTRLEFKNNLQRESSVVSFTAHKTFKEIEYFYKKIKGKHANIKIPSLNENGYLDLDCNLNARQEAADHFVKFVSQDKVLCSSPLLLSFLDYSAERKTSGFRPQLLNSEPQTSESLKSSSKADIKKSSENIFLDDTVEEEETDVFQEFKMQSNRSSKPPPLFTDSPQKKQSKPLKDDFFLFPRQELGGALKSVEIEGLFIPSNSEVVQTSKKIKNTTAALLDDIEDNAELLRIDDSLSDIFREMQPIKKTKPAIAAKPKLLPPTPCGGERKPVPAPRSKQPVPCPRSSANPQPPPPADAAATIDLANIDILSYINSEQQQASSAEDLELFP